MVWLIRAASVSEPEPERRLARGFPKRSPGQVRGAQEAIPVTHSLSPETYSNGRPVIRSVALSASSACPICVKLLGATTECCDTV